MRGVREGWLDEIGAALESVIAARNVSSRTGPRTRRSAKKGRKTQQQPGHLKKSARPIISFGAPSRVCCSHIFTQSFQRLPIAE